MLLKIVGLLEERGAQDAQGEEEGHRDTEQRGRAQSVEEQHRVHVRASALLKETHRIENWFLLSLTYLKEDTQKFIPPAPVPHWAGIIEWTI